MHHVTLVSYRPAYRSFTINAGRSSSGDRRRDTLTKTRAHINGKGTADVVSRTNATSSHLNHTRPETPLTSGVAGVTTPSITPETFWRLISGRFLNTLQPNSVTGLFLVDSRNPVQTAPCSIQTICKRRTHKLLTEFVVATTRRLTAVTVCVTGGR